MSFISVIIVSYNIERELPRTLRSFAPDYQLGVAASDYEVIVVDNGSKNPPRAEDFAHLGIDLTIIRQPNPTHSPVSAINTALNASCGSIVGVFIDGARLASPGVLLRAREAISLDERAVVATRGRYLGPDLQRDTVLQGYDKEVEDEMLADSGWTEDGYRLFDISCFDESSGPTWVSPVSESNGIFMSRVCWWELNGFDPHFQSPGGGLANLDLWKRATELPNARVTVLMGEATFHQLHGGVSTNGSLASIENFFEEYTHLRGKEYEKPEMQPHYFGRFAKRPPATEMVGEIEERIRQTGSALPANPRLDVGGSLLTRILHRFTRKNRALRAEEKRWASVIANTPLFDREWYLRTYPDAGTSGLSPEMHYARLGAFMGYDPGPDFKTEWYYRRYPDVMDAGVNALAHYVTSGRSEGRRAAPVVATDTNEETRLVDLITHSDLFDAEWYQSTYEDVARMHMDPALHFLRYGRLQLRNPSPQFSTSKYIRANSDVELSLLNPLIHYLQHGKEEGRTIYPVSGTN